MSGNNINRKYNGERILDYLHNRMTNRERNAFEREMQKDPFLADAVEGLGVTDPEVLASDMAELNKRFTEISSRNSRKLYLSVAASIAVLAVVSTVFVTVFLDRTRDIPAETGLSVMKTPAFEEPDSLEPHTETLPLTESMKRVSPSPSSEKRKSAEKIIAVPEKPDTRIEDSGKEETKHSAEEVYVLEALKDQVDEEMAEYAEIIESESDTLFMNSEMTAFRPEEESLVSRKLTTAGAPVSASVIPDRSKIKGIVVAAEDDTPVPGATVMIKETQTGALTDINGTFELLIPGSPEDLTLIVDFIGMERREIKVPSVPDIKVELQSAYSALDEVVHIGYGVQKKDFVTGSITTITGDQLLNRTDYQSASPIGGYSEFNTYIKKNMVFPENTEMTKAVVVLNFIVETTGKIREITVVKSPSDVFSKEAIRLLDEGPGWAPATSGGRKVESAVRIRIIFK